MAGLLTCRPVSNAFPLTSTIVRHFIITDWSYMNFQWHIVRPFHKGRLTAAGLSGISTRFPFNHP